MYNINTSVIMKRFFNYSKLAITTLIMSCAFVSCSDEISETTCETQYTASVGAIKNAGTAVDLGLPSGTKWANMNIGATSESDNGILFIWGDVTGNQILPTNTTSYKDVTGLVSESVLFEKYRAENETSVYLYDTTNVYKESFALSEYRLAEIDSIREARFDSIKAEYANSKLDFATTFDDSNCNIFVNTIDSTLVKYFESTRGASISDAPVYSIMADPNHDAATANWGSNWRMPTKEEFQELIDHCTWEFTGNGYRVTSKAKDNKNSIFLPAAGYRYGDKMAGNGNAGYYATGQILGTYNFPSMEDQLKGVKGSIGETDNMPYMLIFQHGQFENAVNIYNNMSSSFGVSIRPVVK